MSKLRFKISMSLDGFVAGLSQSGATIMGRNIPKVTYLKFAR